jgi:hypothetical protein
MQQPKEAKRLILAVMNATRDAACVEFDDGGINVDEVYSRRPGKKHQKMTLEEAERATDAAVREIYKALTGREISRSLDVIEFLAEN